MGETIELMANAEGLQAHKNAVSIRLKKLENEKIKLIGFFEKNLIDLIPYRSAREEYANQGVK